MRIRISGCFDCPFKKLRDDIRCGLDHELLLTDKNGEGFDWIGEKKIHPECRLLSTKAVVTLDVRCKVGDAPLEAFLGNYVRLKSGRRGVIVGKFKAPTELDSASAANYRAAFGDRRPCYFVALDGAGTAVTGPDEITEILRETAPYNYNPDFEFYFGTGADEDSPE